MQQDFDDYPDSGRSNAVSWMVMVAAALGFLALGWFAFYATENGDLDKEVLTLESYADAYKQVPEDAGGLEFPHQDKTLYDALDGTQRSQRVEKLFPEPEAPILQEEPEDVPLEIKKENGSSTSYVAHPSAAEIAQEALNKQENLADALPEPKAIVKPKPKPVTRSAVVKSQPKPKPAPVAPKKPVTIVNANSPHALQLGAFTSQADAKAHWQKAQKKYHAQLGSYTPSIVKAVLSKGTFYRLRAVGFVSKSAASATCKTLSAKGQACFYVKR